MLGSLDDTLKMSQAIDGVEPCLDFAHLHARPGDGSMNTVDEWRILLETYAQALGPIALKNLHVHLSGIEYTPKGEKEHLPILESDLDLEALLKALNDFECDGRIVCESPLMEEDALVIKEKWQVINGEGTV
jgi:deoxyribonuclease-4